MSRSSQCWPSRLNVSRRFATPWDRRYILAWSAPVGSLSVFGYLRSFLPAFGPNISTSIICCLVKRKHPLLRPLFVALKGTESHNGLGFLVDNSILFRIARLLLSMQSSFSRVLRILDFFVHLRGNPRNPWLECEQFLQRFELRRHFKSSGDDFFSKNLVTIQIPNIQLLFDTLCVKIHWISIVSKRSEKY